MALHSGYVVRVYNTLNCFNSHQHTYYISFGSSSDTTHLSPVLRHTDPRSGRDPGPRAAARLHVPSEARLAAAQHGRDLPRRHVPIREGYALQQYQY